jgi:hypothetical protein
MSAPKRARDDESAGAAAGGAGGAPPPPLARRRLATRSVAAAEAHEYERFLPAAPTPMLCATAVLRC